MILLESSYETRKETVSKMLVKMFDQGALGVIDETCSKDIIVHNSKLSEELKGIEAFKGFMKDFLWAFRDIHLHIDDVHAEGDTVDCHASFTATNKASFRGIPATHKTVSTEPVFFFKFGSDGKVMEHWQEKIP